MRKMLPLILSLAFFFWVTNAWRTLAGDGTVIYLPMIQQGATQTPTPIPQSTWLAYLNNLRIIGSLPVLTEDSSWSDGCVKHSRYMVKNNIIEHSETLSNAWYTAEGLSAAQNSNLMVSSSSSYPDEAAIDLWLVGPFHGIGVLDPQLIKTGFGSYREADGGYQMGACLDVLRGLGSLPSGVTFPIFWPGNGANMPYRNYTGGEYPNPLSTCPGYTTPTGAPIYFQLGPGNMTPVVSAHTLRKNGNDLEHCIFDETNYTNPDGSSQSLGRSILNNRDAIVLLPRVPLTTGVYTVTITANNQTYAWSFSISDPANPATQLNYPSLIRAKSQ